MQWHQLDQMQTICTSLQRDNLTNTSSLNFYRPGALPDAQPKLSEHWSQPQSVTDVTRFLDHIRIHCFVWIAFYRMPFLKSCMVNEEKEWGLMNDFLVSTRKDIQPQKYKIKKRLVNPSSSRKWSVNQWEIPLHVEILLLRFLFIGHVGSLNFSSFTYFGREPVGISEMGFHGPNVFLATQPWVSQHC